MKISYATQHGNIELSAFLHGETGFPTYFLHLFGQQMPFSLAHIEALRQFIPEPIEQDTMIIEATKSAGYFKDIKKGISVIIKDSINANIISDKNAWNIFKKYVLNLLEFLKTIYNTMTPEQKNSPEMKKLGYVLKDVGLLR